MSVSVASHIKLTLIHYYIEPVVQYIGRFAQQPAGCSDHSCCLAVALSVNLCLGYGTTPKKKKKSQKCFIFVLCAPHISLPSVNTGKVYSVFYLSLQLISCCCYLVPALSHGAECDRALNVRSKERGNATSFSHVRLLFFTRGWDLNVKCRHWMI